MQTKTNVVAFLDIYATKVPSARLHLIAQGNAAGMLFFACEQAPLLTLQSHGLPTHCPICSNRNPLRGDTNAYQQK
jgi:hypothetical protein